MKTKTKVSGILAAVILATVFAGCAINPRTAAIERATPIRTEPNKKRPKWVDNPRSAETKTTMAIVGSSGKFATATGDYGARAYAEINGRNQLGQYYGVVIADQARAHAAIAGISANTLSPAIISQQLNERISQSAVQALSAKEYFTEVFIDSTNREAYQVYVLMSIDKAIVKNTIDNWGKMKAEEYAQKAAQEIDEARREQTLKAAEFFKSDLSSKLGL
ncbi:hypothetical protein [Treponema sp. R80B11-R83G3]